RLDGFDLQQVIAFRRVNDAAVVAGLERKGDVAEFLAQYILADPAPIAALLRFFALGVNLGQALKAVAGIELGENFIGHAFARIDRRWGRRRGWFVGAGGAGFGCRVGRLRYRRTLLDVNHAQLDLLFDFEIVLMLLV